MSGCRWYEIGTCYRPVFSLVRMCGEYIANKSVYTHTYSIDTLKRYGDIFILTFYDDRYKLQIYMYLKI